MYIRQVRCKNSAKYCNTKVKKHREANVTLHDAFLLDRSFVFVYCVLQGGDVVY